VRLDQNEQITCWRCANDIGMATSLADFGTAPADLTERS
jgi:hypothetical protein